MYGYIPNRFQTYSLMASLALAGAPALAQVQVSGSVSYERSIIPNENFGNEHLTMLGMGHDPDDGVTYIVCLTDTDSPCPSSDNLHIYRHDPVSNAWVFDGSINHLGVIHDAIIDVQGDRIAIGQNFLPGSSIGDDSADVYRRQSSGAWIHEGTLRPADNFVGDFFGFSVSLSGDWLAVGAPREGDDPRPAEEGPGAVYVYRFQNGSWIETDKIVADDGQIGDKFGDEIAINATPTGWRMLVAAPDVSTDPGGINHAGAVYMIENDADSISQRDKLITTLDSQASGDLGGNGIAMDGEFAAVTDRNKIYYYGVSPTGVLQPLSYTSHIATNAFSRPDIENRVIVVGLPYSDPPNIEVVTVPMAGPVNVQTIDLPSGLVPTDGFATSVYTNGEMVGTGVPWLDLAGENAGGVWTQPLMGANYPSGLLLEGAGDPESSMGESIAASDDWIAIGTPGSLDECNPGAHGSVRMLSGAGLDWQTTQYLRPEPGLVGDGFGHAIAIDGETLAVSMPGSIGLGFATPNGAVMMYERSGSQWALTQTIEGGSADVGFGDEVALQGDHLIIAEPNSPGSGRAVYFHRDTDGVWQHIYSFSVGNLSPGARFADTMTIRSDRLFIGAPLDNNATGSVHMHTRNNDRWDYPQALQDPSAQPGSRFGAAVAQNDDFLFVGIPGDGTIPGRVGVYPIMASSLGTPTFISDPTPGAAGFGGSISVKGDLLVVGSDDPAASSVHVFAFNGTDYQLIQSVNTPSGASDARFGSETAIGAETILIGAPDEDSEGVPDGGQVHLYRAELRYTVPECDMDMREDRVQWIEDDTPEAGEWFAERIAVDEGYAIVGVPYEKFSFQLNGQTVNANNAGKAIIYKRTGLREWSKVTHFRGSSLDTNPDMVLNTDWLGTAVDIEGDIAVAGGPQAFDDENHIVSGSVRIYQRGLSGWAETLELFPSANYTPSSNIIRQFGSGVNLDSTGNKLGVGARNSSVGGTGTGAGFVFERSGSGWVESDPLISPTTDFGDHLGDSVAIEEDWAVFGSPDGGTNASGGVHIFHRVDLGSWVYHSSIFAPNPVSSIRFGYAIDLARSDLGLTLVVGTPGISNMQVNSVGAAFVYVLDEANMQWNLLQRLDPQFLRVSTQYGADVRIDHNTIAIGGPLIQNSNQGTNWTGGVDMHNLDPASAMFVRRTTIRADQTEWGNANGWGSAIGLSGGTVFLGTRYADGEPYTPTNNNINSGALVAFDIICVPLCPADFDGDGVLTFFDVSQFLTAYQGMDPSADLNGDGVVDFFDVSQFLTSFSAGC